MLQKLERNEQGAYAPVTAEDFSKAVKRISDVVNVYCWGGMAVCPYGYPVKIKDMIKGWKGVNFDEYTTSSKHMLILEVNGLVDILNAWLKYHEQSGWAVVDNGEIIFTGTEYQCDKTVFSMNNDDLEVRYIGY